MERSASIGEILSASDYDVIVFQEAFCKRIRKKMTYALSKAYPYQAGPANVRLFSLKVNSGVWIFSKYPILSSDAITFKNHYGVDALSRKGSLLVELDFNGQVIQVAGTHLQNAGEEWIRHSQCVEFYHRLLKPYYKDGVPQIICGDFNIDRTRPESYTFMLQSLGASDGELNGTIRYSYDRSVNDLNVEKGDERNLIDYILIRNNGAWVNCLNREIKMIRNRWHVNHQDLSDHFSLEAEILFTNIPTNSVQVAEKIIQ